MAGRSMMSQMWGYAKVRRKWWLLPIILFLVALGVLFVFAPALAPFIYAIF